MKGCERVCHFRVRASGIRLWSVRHSIAIRVARIWVSSAKEFLQICQTVAITIGTGILGVGRIERVVQLPLVGHLIAVRVAGIGVRPGDKFIAVQQSVAVCIPVVGLRQVGPVLDFPPIGHAVGVGVVGDGDVVTRGPVADRQRVGRVLPRRVERRRHAVGVRVHERAYPVV